MPVFLESGTLIGFLRHGDVIPWDEDADLGYRTDDCRKLFPSAGDLQKAVDSVLNANRFETSNFS